MVQPKDAKTNLTYLPSGQSHPLWSSSSLALRVLWNRTSRADDMLRVRLDSCALGSLGQPTRTTLKRRSNKIWTATEMVKITVEIRDAHAFNSDDWMVLWIECFGLKMVMR